MRMQGLLSTLPVKPTEKLRWTGKATDLVELLYALDTCDCINDGEIGIEELADDELREELNKRMVESDLKGGKFKKR